MKTDIKKKNKADKFKKAKDEKDYEQMLIEMLEKEFNANV